MQARSRINVSSGRPLEALAHYSRAIRVGELVLQSGTTAIDRHGHVLGENVSAQIDAILALAKESMGAADGAFENVVRARLYVTDEALLEQAGTSFARAFAATNLAITLVPICQLARPAQLIEIELEAVDGAASTAEHIDAPEYLDVGSGAVLINDRLLIGGIAAHGNSVAAQTLFALNAVRDLIGRAGGTIEDLVGVKIFTTDISRSVEIITATGRALAGVKPTATIVGIPPLADTDVRLVVEAEAVIGAGKKRRDTPHPLFSVLSESVSVDDQIYLSNFGPLDHAGSVQHPGDWAAQIDRCIENLESVLQRLGASLDDVIVRRHFTREDAAMNRIYGEGPGWFARTRPTALGCRIVGHEQPGSLISVDAHAVRGAGNNIDWRTITA